MNPKNLTQEDNLIQLSRNSSPGLALLLTAAFLVLNLCLVIAARNGGTNLDSDSLYAFALLFGFAAVGTFFTWIKIASDHGNKIATRLDLWRRILSAE